MPIKNKIWLPELYGGGSKKFLDLFQQWLLKSGRWEVVVADADVIFFNAWWPAYDIAMRVLNENNGAVVVHRVDGSGIDYGREDDADDRMKALGLLSDVSVFQSEYSKKVTVERGLIRDVGTVILNPVEATEFYKKDHWPGEFPLKVVTTSNSDNKKKGTWKLAELSKKFKDVKFSFIGNAPKSLKDDKGNVEIVEKMQRNELLTELPRHDVFLNLSENDPCPNAVLEAMAAGLPVAYVRSGGVPELVGDCGREITGKEENLNEILKDLAKSEFGQEARKRVLREFCPDDIFVAYERVLLDQLEKSKKDPLFFLRKKINLFKEKLMVKIKSKILR